MLVDLDRYSRTHPHTTRSAVALVLVGDAAYAGLVINEQDASRTDGNACSTTSAKLLVYGHNLSHGNNLLYMFGVAYT
jgi:hypothetical protein